MYAKIVHQTPPCIIIKAISVVNLRTIPFVSIAGTIYLVITHPSFWNTGMTVVTTVEFLYMISKDSCWTLNRFAYLVFTGSALQVFLITVFLIGSRSTINFFITFPCQRYASAVWACKLILITRLWIKCLVRARLVY